MPAHFLTSRRLSAFLETTFLAGIFLTASPGKVAPDDNLSSRLGFCALIDQLTPEQSRAYGEINFLRLGEIMDLQNPALTKLSEQARRTVETIPPEVITGIGRRLIEHYPNAAAQLALPSQPSATEIIQHHLNASALTGMMYQLCNVPPERSPLKIIPHTTDLTL
jgi:hypothetical protein